ncbi:hypothetical protein SDC9_156292 [bioreactor metagenome]|uniref:Uncharacterized protein n=1 Tax=bioreactor metagenome TaxID=1076179 RepID=A0A645F8T0_9ZZZZ
MEAKTIEYNGVKLTEYEASQKQRAIERKIRAWKREAEGMSAAGYPNDEALSRVSYWQAKQRDFIKQTGLKRQPEREQIKGRRSNLNEKSAV